MDSTSSLVVKVSYGGVLRRFRVPVKPNGQLDLHMAGLRGKIAALFSLPVDADFSLTYSDEDGDVVALVDENDLFDVANQRLNFLKINVQSNTGSQNPVSVIRKGVNDVMKAVPNPMRDSISEVYIDLTSKAASSSPVVGELFDCISKLGKLSVPQEGSPCPPPVTKPGSSGLRREIPSAGEKKDITKKTQTGKRTGGGASFNECPFSGRAVNGSSPNPVNLNKYPPGVSQSKKISNGDNWSSFGVFHKGIQCDGCGVVPITGPRFKSNVREDYDLCNTCFSMIGNGRDYTRMDKPISAQNLQPFRRQLAPFSNPWMGPVPQPQYEGSNLRRPWPKPLDSSFVLDVNVLDGTVFAPSAPFTKIWRMRNNGSQVWPKGTKMMWIGGERFSNYESVDLQIPVEGVPFNGELDVEVDFVAPESPGQYISYWMMASSSYLVFGQRVSVLINVDASLKGFVENEFHGLNLNASPDESGISSANAETLRGADIVQEAAAGSQIAGIDGVLVRETERGVPHTLTPSSSSSSLSIVELPSTPKAEALSGSGSSSTKDIHVPLQEDIEKDVETTMLKELEEMGFKEVDLNKEILRENEYNLEQSLDALCGVNEWDPILEELQEMGFCDDVTNKRLLKKNNGSIKGVVMDILNGEKKA